MSVFCFNDLSPIPLCDNDMEVESRIDAYTKTIKAANRTLELKKIRYNSTLDKILVSKNTSLQDYCNKNINDPKAILLISTHTMPQVDMQDDESLSKYLDATTTIFVNNTVFKADGFNAGYCQGFPCIGFASPDWLNRCLYEIVVSSEEKTSKTLWGCVSCPNHVDDKDFLNWYSTFSEIVLLTCPIETCNKKIKIRGDHGYDVLFEHAKNLVKCCYVESIINSLPFNSYSKSYIHRVYDDGKIDLVLYWHDKGFSMRIQTTGRNIRETKQIALLIKDKYGR